MQVKTNPLKVIINPPGVQFGMPGDTLELHAVVINQGNQSAVIDVFFDEGFQTLNPSSTCPRERLALAPQQSNEVTFQFQIPINALPGTYDYILVVDAPEHYPQDTPIQYPRQIKVLLKEQTVIRENDPTFSLKPSTNPSNPLIFQDEPLQVVVTVDNRSSRVDRFRLTCLDLEEDWLTIRYPTTGLEGPGLLGANRLELNPSSVGQILLQFHPPTDTLAGSYSPTIRLYSDNSPDLVLLDLVYIQIPALYLLDVELNTILGKVSRSSGKYEVKLANQGNTLRELAVSAKSQDEEELCTYQCEPSQVRVLPTRSVGVNLTVKPICWWRRPLFGAGLVLNFNIEIQDQQELPLPEKLPQGTLVWKARPWWQFLLIILAVLGLLSGVAFIVWRILHPDPLKVEYFRSDSPRYIEGDRVRLSWEIHNSTQLQKLVLITKGQVPNERSYDFIKGIPNELGKDICEQEKQVLTCTNFETEANIPPGKYTFELKAFLRSGTTVSSQTDEVEIVAKPAPEVVNFQPERPEYTKGEQVGLSWEIRNPDQISKLKIVGKLEDGIFAPVIYDFNQDIPQQLSKVDVNTSQPLCKKVNQLLTCKNVPVAAPKPGKYTFELQAFSKSTYQPNPQPTETKVNIKPKPFKIVYFTLNGSDKPNQVLKDGEPVTLSWKVEGEDINVELSPYGNVNPSDSKPLTANEAFPPQIELIVTDKFGQQPAKKGFSIKVEKLEPTPTPNDNITPALNDKTVETTPAPDNGGF